MKAIFFKLVLVGTLFVSSANTFKAVEEIDLACVRKHNASNSCHYNFTIGGINYRYVDLGCKASRESILKKAKEGKLGLAKDWKIVCPSKKPS